MPAPPEFQQPARQVREAQFADVSPISSQHSFHNGSEGSLVSPIEGSFSTLKHEKSGKSQIPRKLPSLHKSPDDNIKKRWNLKKAETGETRWDEYSGEPSQVGKAASVRPGESPASSSQAPYPQLKERTRQILAGLKDRESVKKSSWGKVPPPVAADPLDNPPQRPPWRGASGRSAIVDPVKNTPEARTKPLALVERHRKPEATARTPTPEQATKSPTSPVNNLSVAASQLTVRNVPSQESIKPVPPLKSRRTSNPNPVEPAPLSPKQLEYSQLELDSPFHSPGPPPPIPPYSAHRKPSLSPERAADSPTLGSNAPSFVDSDRNESQASPEPNLKPPPLQREPDTTSSWNTYASGTKDDDYDPYNPVAKEHYTSSPTTISRPFQLPTADPISLRKRVAANNGGHRSYDTYSSISPFGNVDNRKSSSSILRKAVGSDTASIHTDRNGKARAVSLMSVTSKSLPPTPVEMEALQAEDKVSSLQARLDDLARRKRNSNRIIHELEESLKKNAIIYDAWKRKEVEKTIINMQGEIQDVKNEEHEVQLKLYRVQKRRDKDDFYEKPTGLWIKRVTT
jgi:hypothetical protein